MSHRLINERQISYANFLPELPLILLPYHKSIHHPHNITKEKQQQQKNRS
jgi:hypothetical protein